MRVPACAAAPACLRCPQRVPHAPWAPSAPAPQTLPIHKFHNRSPLPAGWDRPGTEPSTPARPGTGGDLPAAGLSCINRRVWAGRIRLTLQKGTGGHRPPRPAATAVLGDQGWGCPASKRHKSPVAGGWGRSVTPVPAHGAGCPWRLLEPRAPGATPPCVTVSPRCPPLLLSGVLPPRRTRKGDGPRRAAKPSPSRCGDPLWARAHSAGAEPVGVAGGL